MVQNKKKNIKTTTQKPWLGEVWGFAMVRISLLAHPAFYGNTFSEKHQFILQSR